MTFGALLKKLQKMKPEQLKERARVLEGSSGHWKPVIDICKAEDDFYHPECAPGERRYEECQRYGIKLPSPVVRKNKKFILI